MKYTRHPAHNLSAGFVGIPGRHTKVTDLVPWAGCATAAVRPEDSDEDVAMLLASVELGPRVSGRLTAQNNVNASAAYRAAYAVAGSYQRVYPEDIEHMRYVLRSAGICDETGLPTDECEHIPGPFAREMGV